ncbi:MAG: SUMF1/EgtB/PvdO family nonheme iron enzyme [Cyclobacteriaceae bacterium]
MNCEFPFLLMLASKITEGKSFITRSIGTLFLLTALSGYSNNLHVTNLEIASNDDQQAFAMVKFDISWENSWRDDQNWDAVWVFIKFNAGNGWEHGEINYSDGLSDGHTSPDEAVITATPDHKGVFIYLAEAGSGNNNFSNIQLRWNYGSNGLADIDGIELKVLGIEMVYVQEGSFWLGDGESQNIQGHFESAASGNPFQVTSENEITLGGGGQGSLGNNNGEGMSNNGDAIPAPYNTISMDDFNDSQSQVLPTAFPKGFMGFYCMKYELTQEQYVEFLNMLTATQANTRFDPNPHSVDEASVRYTISGSHPNFTTTTPHVTAIFVEYYDGAAYADWSGLRPMTELEFEKACRGPLTPVAGEYAWGTTNLNSTFQIIENLNAENENISTGFDPNSGNAWINQVNSLGAAVRVGIFAANPNTTGRESSGATYWGIMEMSGNCWERAVTVGRPEGRAFEGTHGDGQLNESGNANNADWPGHSGNDGIDDVIGVGYRGAGFEFPAPVELNLRTSARRMATSFYHIRYYDDTMRLVRTSPHN